MSSDIAISVRNLTKTYRIFNHPGDRIKQALTLGRLKFHREFTALKDVSFDIKKGETVGIIGRNGSGKSTLLQLICGILKPTSGSVNINGRVSALLELGSGFNPEFTGRENIYFQGAIMGFTKEKMDAKVDDIIAFADIGEFIDQPVRTYSSGMFVRLAFAVAIHSEPEILVVDEALSVGDMAFQNKCMTTINRARDNGVAIMVVSHDTFLVRSICDRGILIQNGVLVAMDVAGKVCDEYVQTMRLASSMTPPANTIEEGDIQSADEFRVDDRFMTRVATTRYGSGEVKVTAVEMMDSVGLPLRQVQFGERAKIRIHVLSMVNAQINVAYQIRDQSLLPILSGSIILTQGNTYEILQNKGVVFEFMTELPIAKGEYSLLVQVVNYENSSPVFVDVVECAETLEVLGRTPHQVWSKVYLDNALKIFDQESH